MRLYTYCIPVDDGAAPNPYYGLCTLAICKPRIRRTAQIGDWIVGTGSKSVNKVDYSNKVVYAMKVTNKMTFAEYNAFCERELQEKIPDINNDEYERRLGDCIYTNGDLDDHFQRRSVHGAGNIQTDKGGENVLISDYFFYFGSDPIDLPEELLNIVHQTQGHKVAMNNPYVGAFVSWIEGLGLPANRTDSAPQIGLYFDESGCKSSCGEERKKAAEEGEEGIC